MDLDTADIMARELLSIHLPEWDFGWNNRKRSLGVCKHSSSVIELSRTATSVNEEHVVKNTILHEIAHALVGIGHGHDSVWQAMAKSIGCDGKRCGIIDKTNLGELGVKWVMVDPNGVVCKHWFRKPAKTTFAKLSTLYLTHRKEETLGKLSIITYDTYLDAFGE